ncbi:MAG: hypothetical protein MJE68_19920 [Proteobacteria bacterium]|nr:hypothetical protein [Pseudomonadota bacterium]
MPTPTPPEKNEGKATKILLNTFIVLSAAMVGAVTVAGFFLALHVFTDDRSEKRLDRYEQVAEERRVDFEKRSDEKIAAISSNVTVLSTELNALSSNTSMQFKMLGDKVDNLSAGINELLQRVSADP